MAEKKTKRDVGEVVANCNPDLRGLLTPIGNFQHDPANARLHPERNHDLLRTSLAGYKQNKPIVAMPDGTVIAGNGTLDAARALGWTHIAAVTFDGTAEQAREYAIVDNRSGELSRWDPAALLEQLDPKANLAELEAAIPAEALGFTPAELDALRETSRTNAEQHRVPLDDLKPHPRNYRTHPDDQLDHLGESIKSAGFYRQVVVARDWTILAGHGIVQAARRAGLASVPVLRLDVAADDPRALRILAADNEIPKLAEADDRALSELLKEVLESGVGLLGSGYDAEQLAALVYVTRPASEIADSDDAAAWVGMPEFKATKEAFKLVMNFATDAERQEFLNTIGVHTFGRKEGNTWSCWWPPQGKDDNISVKFTEGGS